MILKDWLKPLAADKNLKLLVLAMAIFMGWIAFGHGADLPWDSRFYLPVHTTLEIMSVVIMMLVFSTGCHGIVERMPMRVALLAPGALSIALLDIGHLMTVPGMPGLGVSSNVKGIELLLAGRGMAAITLLWAALAPRTRTVGGLGRLLAFLAALLISAVCFRLSFVEPRLLPPTFIPGKGMTRFKIGSEIVLITLNTVATVLLLFRARMSGMRSDRFLAASAALTGLTGVGFALYAAPDDGVAILAHVYKVTAYLLLYRAVWIDAVAAPYQRLQDSERSLAASEAGFRSLMECAPDAILLTDRTDRITMMNVRAEELFAISRSEARGQLLSTLVPDESPDADLICLRPHSGGFPAEVRRAGLPSGQQVAIVRDLSERRRLERALVEQLTHDALTGLPNRRRVLETLGDAISTARQTGRTLAVLVLDIDEFSKINSTYGFAEGDEVLRVCVERLTRLLQSAATLARQSGNEFIIVQPQADGVAAATLAAAMVESMRDVFPIGGRDLFLSASVGIALLPEEPCSAIDFLQMAQVAMAAARANGPGHFEFFCQEIEKAMRDRVKLEAQLRHAVERGQLALQFQPRVDLATNSTVGVEALVRWQHPEAGLVPPARFIPLAEETGLIDAIDIWVLGEACQRAATWRARGLAPLRVSINLSARQFSQTGLAQRVHAALDGSGLPPSCLEIEITEGTVMKDTEQATAVLHSLKTLGVALAIDDFGTGYSSLSYLKRFPIDVLKIDRSFINDVTTDSNDAAITCAIIALAHSLNLEALAEGAETAEQVAFLRKNGCDVIQGYYFSRPLWPDQLEAWLTKEGDRARLTVV